MLFLIAGLSLGLSAGFSPGPLFALVISQTVQFGLKEGVKTALAPLITDIPIIGLSLLLLSRLASFQPFLGCVSLAGGVLLVYMAWENLKIKKFTPTIDTGGSRSFLRGATINALSPHPYLFWITIGGPTLLNAYAHGHASALGFALGFYAALVGAKLLLAIVVNKSRNFMNGKTYRLIMRCLGLLLLVFAGLLLKEGLILLTGR